MIVASRVDVIFTSPQPESIFCYTPGIAVATGGRLVATLDLGGEGMYRREGGGSRTTTRQGEGVVMVSDDRGVSWREVHRFPFWHARPFVVEGKIFIIGNMGDIAIIGSEDNGETWTKSSLLTEGEKWHGSACNVLFRGDAIHLAMERRLYSDRFVRCWNVAGLSPVLWTANRRDNLLLPEAWRRSPDFAFCDAIGRLDGTELFGIPLYPDNQANTATMLGHTLTNAPSGWLEANVVGIDDENHIWHDGRSLHLLLRTHLGGAVGYAAVVKMSPGQDGEWRPGFQVAPSGKEQVFLPFPGGHLKFFILHDAQSGYYWLASNQATDSTRTLDSLSKTPRVGLPNNERHRLQLHFSKNCVDWCLAGMIACSLDERRSCNYPAMAVNGDDLHVVCRSADADSRDPQYSNLITHHLVEDFRSLIY